MKEFLTIPDTIKCLRHISKTIIENEPVLTGIDLQTGDGDHGIGMKRGFTAVLNMLDNGDGYDRIGVLLKSVGMKLIDTIGGASGVLYGTLFISGISGIGHDDRLELSDIQEALWISINAIMRRGGAKPGDKTMIDALAPAAESLLISAQKGESLVKAAKDAYLAALQGAENTKRMIAKKGRAMTFREKSIGYADAGATSSALIFKAFYECVEEIFVNKDKER